MKTYKINLVNKMKLQINKNFLTIKKLFLDFLTQPLLESNYLINKSICKK